MGYFLIDAEQEICTCPGCLDMMVNIAGLAFSETHKGCGKMKLVTNMEAATVTVSAVGETITYPFAALSKCMRG